MDKEKSKKDLFVRVPPSLFDKFKEVCNLNYKSVSEAIRDLMQFYINKNNGNTKNK